MGKRRGFGYLHLLTYEIIHRSNGNRWPLAIKKQCHFNNGSCQGCGSGQKRYSLTSPVFSAAFLQLLLLQKSNLQFAQFQQKCPSNTLCFGIVLIHDHFPNDALTNDWYDGRRRIHSLYFHKSNLKTIEPNAFECGAFEDLRKLSIASVAAPIEIKRGAFDGLANLRSLMWSNMVLANIDYRILHAFTSTQLATIKIVNCNSDAMSTYDLLGTVELNNLKALHLHENPLMFHGRITSNSFGRMAKLETLALQSCAIETIHAETFENMPSIGHLNLEHNLLKTLALAVFERFPWMLTDLQLDNNPWACDCQLYRLKKFMVDQEFGYQRTFRDICNRIEVIEVAERLCRYAQRAANVATTIEQRQCILHSGTNTMRIKYGSRVTLKFIQLVSNWYAGLLIQHSKRIYVLVMESTAPKFCNCANKVYECHRFDSIRNRTDVRLMVDGMRLVCAMDLDSNGTVWPLNCITYNRAKSANFWITEQHRYRLLAVYILLSITSFVVPLGLVLSCAGSSPTTLKVWMSAGSPFNGMMGPGVVVIK